MVICYASNLKFVHDINMDQCHRPTAVMIRKLEIQSQIR